MQLDVQVISEEIVKPSSPTDDRLRRYQLSFLDQQTPLVYNAMVYFYPKICNIEANKITILHRLKQSISNALTCFYPLAGRIMEDQLFVDCNDEGIPFLEARVKCQLLDVLNNPIPKELNKLLPFEFHVSGTDAEHVLLGIQFNVFDCGGIGIGVCISHKIGDALSFFSFVNIWASIARGETNLIVPEFKSASLFPPRAIPEARQLKKEQIVTKRFVFGATKVEEIRRKYGENTSQTRPSRVEALSAFIWDRFVTAFGLRSRPDTLSTIIHVVNLRARIDPPLPGSSFGNLYSLALTIPSMDNNIVTQIRDY
ncbi:stemmadenine O-acetyltransferase [Gossypium hirsutum]|uniref:Stemmadenine O-acetyltransferase n=1 Tax=Gossypium hirsutum TaxID=3635 RepID=A0A1U8IDC9_GOSHI|nr:stemmadenine O-acetyltransferase-like [Gossypium hirsutum]